MDLNNLLKRIDILVNKYLRYELDRYINDPGSYQCKLKFLLIDHYFCEDGYSISPNGICPSRGCNECMDNILNIIEGRYDN